MTDQVVFDALGPVARAFGELARLVAIRGRRLDRDYIASKARQMPARWMRPDGTVALAWPGHPRGPRHDRRARIVKLRRELGAARAASVVPHGSAHKAMIAALRAMDRPTEDADKRRKARNADKRARRARASSS